MLKRNKMSSSLLKMAVLGVLAAPTVTWAHGAVSEPIARQMKCSQGGGFDWPPDGSAVPNAACRQAFLATGTLSNYISRQKYQVAANVPGYNDQENIQRGVPSGKLCSAADPQFRGLDLPSPDWYKTTVTPKEGKIKVTLEASQPHNPSWVKIYLSKPSYNPQNALGWEDIELIHEQQAPAPQASKYIYDVALPVGRTGDAVLFVHWQREDSGNEGFYNCSDIKIEGNDGGHFPWHPKETLIPQGFAPNAGDSIRFRVMTGAAGNEVVDEKLAITTQNQATAVWAQQLATTLNTTHGHLVNVGIRSGNSISYDPNKVYENRVFLKNEKDTSAISIIPGEEPPPVPNPPVARIEGPGEIGSGKALTLDASKSVNGSGGSDRLTYVWETTVPYSGPLNTPVLRLTAPAATDPVTVYASRVTVTDAANGKAHTAVHNVTVTPPAGDEYPAYVEYGPYKSGDRVSHRGANYECKPGVANWCNENKLYREPGRGIHWMPAWDQL